MLTLTEQIQLKHFIYWFNV